MTETKQLSDLHGLVASIITAGHTDDLFAQCWAEMRVYNQKEGFTNTEYMMIPAALVEGGRDSAVMHSLEHNYDFLLQIDADMTFAPDSMVRMLHRLFADLPFADVLGGYCNLKQAPYLPTIDTGTGTWEPHYPNSGVLEVIRTGAAFVMCKTEAFRRFGPPWFRTKISNKPLDALANVDNFARCKLDGNNPLSNLPEWTALLADARQAGPGESGIGEDSGFCDRLKAAGGRIFVDTDIVAGHVGKEVITWEKLKETRDKMEELRLLACGVGT